MEEESDRWDWNELKWGGRALQGLAFTLKYHEKALEKFMHAAEWSTLIYVWKERGNGRLCRTLLRWVRWGPRASQWIPPHGGQPDPSKSDCSGEVKSSWVPCTVLESIQPREGIGTHIWRIPNLMTSLNCALVSFQGITWFCPHLSKRLLSAVIAVMLVVGMSSLASQDITTCPLMPLVILQL